jgi:glycerol-3-phosphate acyltransferase PlsY
VILSTTAFYIIAAIAGYLAGSIPFGLLLTKIAGAGDIRAIGSGNIGATNVLRTGRKGLAALTLLLDGLKGIAVVLLAATQSVDIAAIAGLAAVIGHNFPVWLKFKGGKGVATTSGVLMAISWPVGVAFCSTWILVFAITRYSSLAAIVALAAAPFYAYLFSIYGYSNVSVIVLAAILATLGIVRHHANIRRLLRGEESRFVRKRAADDR